MYMTGLEPSRHTAQMAEPSGQVAAGSSAEGALRHGLVDSHNITKLTLNLVITGATG